MRFWSITLGKCNKLLITCTFATHHPCRSMSSTRPGLSARVLTKVRVRRLSRRQNLFVTDTTVAASHQATAIWPAWLIKHHPTVHLPDLTHSICAVLCDPRGRPLILRWPLKLWSPREFLWETAPGRIFTSRAPPPVVLEI